MAYQVMIIRDNSTHEFVCDDFSNGALPSSVAFQNVVDPVDNSKYHKVVVFAPGDIMNFRVIEE